MVAPGVVQLEMGGIFTRPSPGLTAFASPFTARIGLLENRLEVRAAGDGWVRQSDADGSASGFGNLQLGAKLGVWKGLDGKPALSILPAVNIPTASAGKGLGSGDADYTVAVLTGIDIGPRGHVDVNYGLGAIGAGFGAPHFVQHLVSASASLAATPRWNPYAEAFWYSREAPGAARTTSIDTGAIYLVSPRLALDGGLQSGLTKSADDFAAFAGVSFIVGDVTGGRSKPLVRGTRQ